MRYTRIIIMLTLICVILLTKAYVFSSESLPVNMAQYYNASANPALSDYDKYLSNELGICFIKPRNWNVYIDGNTIWVKPSYKSTIGVFLYPILRAHPKTTALSLIRFLYDEAKKVYPDIKIEDKRVNKNDTFAEVIAVFTSNNEIVRGFYIVSIAKGMGLFCGYEAPVNKFDSGCTVLRKILSSLQIVPLNFYNATKSGSYKSANLSAGRGPTIDIKSLSVRPSSDNSMFIAVPPDWLVGGGNYVLVATSPDERMIVWATNDHQPGGVTDPYFYLTQRLFPFFKASGVVICKREPNNDMMNALRLQGLASNIENFYGEVINGNGVKVRFTTMVEIVYSPYGGVGFISTVGFSAVPELYERNKDVLTAIALSISPNQGVIMGRLNENLARLAEASKTVSATGDIVIQSINSSTANIDRAIDKYNYYLSGEEARYSPLENKIYVVDSNLANYASNPNYPQEMLTTVPDNLWNQLPHERDW